MLYEGNDFFFVFLVQFTLSSLEGPFFVTALEVRAIWNNSVVIKAAETFFLSLAKVRSTVY